MITRTRELTFEERRSLYIEKMVKEYRAFPTPVTEDRLNKENIPVIVTEEIDENRIDYDTML